MSPVDLLYYTDKNVFKIEFGFYKSWQLKKVRYKISTLIR